MKRRVLIIDDDPGVLFLHELMVVESGLDEDPELFSMANEALDFIILKACPEQFFLLFLDINMPKMNGWDFLDQLLNNPAANRIKVVMVTSSLSFADRERARVYEKLVIDFWEKPISEVECKQLLVKHPSLFATA